MKVEDGKVVLISYELCSEDGDVLEEVGEDEAFGYLHGYGNIIQGLEAGLDGIEEGDDFDVTVEPEQAYGEHAEELVGEIGLDMFPDEQTPEPGQVFQASTEEGEGVQMLRILEVHEDEGKVIVDGNHPLAGETLDYTGTVVEVRDATDEELEAGKPEFNQ